MAVKNAVYKVDNGAGGFDEIMFKTKPDQVVFKDNTTLEHKFRSSVMITSEGSEPWIGEKEGLLELTNNIGMVFGFFTVDAQGETSVKKDYLLPTKISDRVKHVLGPVLCIADCHTDTAGWCSSIYNSITKTIYCRTNDMTPYASTKVRYLMLVELN